MIHALEMLMLIAINVATGTDMERKFRVALVALA